MECADQRGRNAAAALCRGLMSDTAKGERLAWEPQICATIRIIWRAIRIMLCV